MSFRMNNKLFRKYQANVLNVLLNDCYMAIIATSWIHQTYLYSDIILIISGRFLCLGVVF